jgi:serine/threonine protein phosphatase PrpC
MTSLAATVSVTSKQFSGHINQLKKAQDYSTHGFSYDKTGKFHFIVVCDGHGTQFNFTTNKKTNKIIDAFYSDFNAPIWSDILKGEKDEINDKLTDYISNLGDTTGIGTTFVGVKIYDTHYDVFWIGDSSIWIYENNNRVFENKTHNYNNPEEMNRMTVEHKNVPILDSDDIKKINDNTLLKVSVKYFQFSFRDKIAMTHSLGHEGITGNFISHNRYNKKPGKHYKIIASSDGFTDMVDPLISPADKRFIENNEHSAEDYTKYAEKMWKKKWDFQVPGYAKIKQSFLKDDYDDIAVELFIETT